MFLGGLLCLCLGSCGGEGLVATPTPIRDRCPSEDSYLAGLYALIDSGQLAHIEAALSDELSMDLRSDLVAALIELIAALPDGTMAGLEGLIAPPPSDVSAGPKLAIVLRWVASTGPQAPYANATGALRRVLATCEAKPALRLASEFVANETLREGVATFLAEGEGASMFAELTFDEAQGREALRALVRVLMKGLQSPDLDAGALVDLLGLLVDLESSEGQALRDFTMASLEPGPELDKLVALVACVEAADAELALLDLLFDLVTDDGLSIDQLFAGDSVSLQPALWASLADVLDVLAQRPTIRRALADIAVFLLGENIAFGVLGDIANALDAGVLDEVVALGAALESHACP